MSTSTMDIRNGLRRAAATRDIHSAWFYGTWLFNRHYGTAIVINIVVVIATVAIVRAL